jgi:hypothetical protein
MVCSTAPGQSDSQAKAVTSPFESAQAIERQGLIFKGFPLIQARTPTQIRFKLSE